MSITREIRDILARISDLERTTSKLPSRISQSAGGSGSGGGTGASAQYWEIKESKAELSLDVDPWVLGLVQNSGATAEDGRRYYLNSDQTAWVCWTHLE